MLVSQRDLGSKFTRATHCLVSDSSVAIKLKLSRPRRSLSLSLSLFREDIQHPSCPSLRSAQTASPAHCYWRFVYATPALFGAIADIRLVNSLDVDPIETRHTRNLATAQLRCDGVVVLYRWTEVKCRSSESFAKRSAFLAFDKNERFNMHNWKKSEKCPKRLIKHSSIIYLTAEIMHLLSFSVLLSLNLSDI